jgi:hypothetical protein
VSNESPLSVSVKAGVGYEAPMITVRADDPNQLAQRLEGVKQLVIAGVVDLATTLANTYGAAVGLGGQDVKSEPTPAASPWGPAPATSPAPSAPAAPAPAAPPAAGNAQPFTRQDRYGNTFEYNLPDAPMSPRGPMVKATRKKRAGGTYTMWLDPAHKAVPTARELHPGFDQNQIVPDQWVN